MMNVISLPEIGMIGFLFLIVAIVYSSIGHAGASGYSAVLALFSVTHEIFRPTALVLNVVVGIIAIYRFHRANLIEYKKVFPFLATSMPATFLSAQVQVNQFYFFLAFF